MSKPFEAGRLYFIQTGIAQLAPLWRSFRYADERLSHATAMTEPWTTTDERLYQDDLAEKPEWHSEAQALMVNAEEIASSSSVARGGSALWWHPQTAGPPAKDARSQAVLVGELSRMRKRRNEIGMFYAMAQIDRRRSVDRILSEVRTYATHEEANNAMIRAYGELPGYYQQYCSEFFGQG